MKPPAFSSLPFFVYPVSNMNRACAFYRDTLGLTETARWDNFWVEFALSPENTRSVIALSTIMTECTPGAPGGAVALETSEFTEMVAYLKAAEVPFLMEPTKTEVCHFARFQDPDGNHLILHRIHDQPAS